MRTVWLTAGAMATLLVASMHLLGGILHSPDPEMAALFAAMEAYRPGGDLGTGLSMLDILQALGLAFGLLIAVPALQSLTAVFSRQESDPLLRSLAVWNTVWAVCLAITMAAFGIVPGIMAFSLIGGLFGASLIPRPAANTP